MHCQINQIRSGSSRVAAFSSARSAVRRVALACRAHGDGSRQQSSSTRREVVLMSVNSAAVLGALFTFGAAPRPRTLGLQSYGPDVKTLGLCPPTPNCISTAEELNDPDHFVPPWTYNPQDGRGLRKPVSQDQAMQELVSVVTSVKPDRYSPRIVQQERDYLYVEYESPVFGFIDDVEFYFPPGQRSLVEYRSASRVGRLDAKVDRKRIKALRQALEKKGWASTAGY